MSRTNPLEVVSDVICPWCYVGKRRLERALEILGGDAPGLAWKPFELNPDMPREGIDRRTYRSRKFGGWERSLAMDAQLAEIGQAQGIAFHFERALRTPNTFDAHRLIWFAARAGHQDRVVEACFAAYFTEGRDIGDQGVLARIGAECGLEEDDVRAFLRGEEGAAEVRAETTRFAALGIRGVPTVLAGRVVLFSGAQPPEEMARAIRAQR